MKVCNKCSEEMFDRCMICGICGSNDLKQTTVQRIKPAQVEIPIGRPIDKLVLKNYNNIAIIGSRGSGKSFLANTLKKIIKEKHGLESIIYEDVVTKNKRWMEVVKQMTFNRHNSVINIVTGLSMKEMPKRVQADNNLIMLTSLSSEMLSAMPNEFEEHRAIMTSFYENQKLNNYSDSNRKYLGLTDHGCWIGEFEHDDGMKNGMKEQLGVMNMGDSFSNPNHFSQGKTVQSVQGRRKKRGRMNRRPRMYGGHKSTICL